MTGASEESLWRRWRAQGDRASRDRLVERYLPYALGLARKKAVPRTVDRDELESAATVGLIQAVERYDCRSTSFTAYAWRRIQGAMQDSLRTRYHWSRRYGRAPPLHLEHSDHLVGRDDPDPLWIEEEALERFISLSIRRGRDREIIRMWGGGSTLERIGSRFGLSAGRVCQIVGAWKRKTLMEADG